MSPESIEAVKSFVTPLLLILSAWALYFVGSLVTTKRRLREDQTKRLEQLIYALLEIVEQCNVSTNFADLENKSLRQVYNSISVSYGKFSSIYRLYFPDFLNQMSEISHFIDDSEKGRELLAIVRKESLTEQDVEQSVDILDEFIQMCGRARRTILGNRKKMVESDPFKVSKPQSG